MSNNKPTPGSRAKKQSAVSLARSSAAEYLSFVAATGQGGVEAVYADENVWLSQKMMGQLYDVDVRTISYHLKNVFAVHELEENSVIQSFRITAADGKSYDTQHYNLSATIAVGYKVSSERAVQFRKWAILGKKYFEEQLQRIRNLRSSARQFYQSAVMPKAPRIAS